MANGIVYKEVSFEATMVVLFFGCEVENFLEIVECREEVMVFAFLFQFVIKIIEINLYQKKIPMISYFDILHIHFLDDTRNISRNLQQI